MQSTLSGSNIYVAGNFTNAGVDPNADYIAKMDGGTWAALGANPLNNAISALAVAGATVYAGGAFTDFAAGGNTNLSHIATWDGSSWSAMGSGVNNSVSALTLAGSDLYVGGAFINAGGNPSADLIAKWDGSAWSALGSGLTSVSVNAIVASGSNVYVGGNFTHAGGDVNADYIARWNGSSWSALGATALNNTVSAIIIDGLDLYAGGAFIDAGGTTTADRIARFQIDGTAPTVDSFTATSPSNSLNIPITAFTASDNVSVTGYKITESSTPPAASDSGWTVSIPSTYTVAGNGDYILYPWVKDASGNISTVYGSPASVTVDASAPTVTSFTVPASATSLTVSITDFTASDNIGVTGYLITESSTPPAAGDAGWVASAPSNYTFNSYGNKTLYPWAKDASGNVSAVYGSPASISVSVGAPTVTAFTVPASTTSLTVSITTFTASDNIGVTGYLITESSTPPAAGDAGWAASAPTSYTFNSYGDKTLYPWAKDASGNVSAVYGSPATVSSCLAAITVTSSADSGAGTLRQAIADLCAGGTITFDSSLSGGTIKLNSTLTLSKNIIIDGSALASKITISGDSDNNGSGDVRIFMVENNTTITMNSLIVTKGSATTGGSIYMNTITNLTITNSTFLGNSATDGGAIYKSGGTLLVVNSTFSGNSATSQGGGISNNGPLTITNSTFSGNTAGTNGGGIYNSTGTLTVTNSTFSVNTAGANGGSIYGVNTSLPVTNSTFSGNTATTNGGGIFTISSTITFRNSTFSGNSANSGGGIYVNNSTLNYANTIIANSPAGGDCVNAGTLGTNTNNLVEDGSCSASLSGDPGLGVLAANGGSTQTLALLAGSPAIDAGDDTICAASPVSNLDQRGITRPAGAHCDIGAYEYYADNTAPTITAFTVPSTSTNLEIPINTFSASDNTGVTDYLITESSSQPSAGDAGWTASVLTTYTVASSGEYTLYPWAKDALGNVSAVYDSPASVSVDNTAPSVVSIVRASTNPTNAASVDFTVTFSESVTGADTGDFSLLMSGVSGASISGVTGSGATRTVSVNTGSGDGSIRLDLLNNNSIQDSVGNSLSGSFTSGESYTLDKTAPTLTAFSAPSTSTSLNIPITTFSAADNIGVTDYLITESSLPPTADNAGWTASAPTTYPVSSEGSYTLYPWTKDATGNVSAIYGSPASVSVDTSAPAVTAFTVPFNVTSLNIPITSFTASDNISVAGYKITTSSVPPSAGAVGWDVSAPTTYTVASDGFYALYPWVKDAAGNVSSVYGSPGAASVDATVPTVSSINRVTVSPSAKVSVQFLVTFSEAVTGVTTTDFSLTTTGSITGSSITSVSAGTNTYTVTVSTGSGDGTLRLNIPNTATITDLNGNTLSSLPYISGQVYTISKTLIYTSTGSQDGWILESSEISNLGGTLNATATTFRLGDDITNKQYRSIISFKTSSIPDNATITGVKLKIKKQGITGGGNPLSIFQGFMVDIKKGLFGAANLQVADFQTAASKIYGPLPSMLASNWYSINLTTGKAYINKLSTNAGLTQLRLRFKLDDNNNAIANYLSLYSGNAPAASRPQLIVTYTTP